MQYDTTVINLKNTIEPDTDRSKVSYWLKWIAAAKKASNQHWCDARAAWDEYLNKSRTDLKTPEEAREYRTYPAYKTYCKTLEPAFYSRTPKQRVDREFGINDQVGLTAEFITDRLASYCLKTGDFDTAMRHGVKDLIHADKASVQVLAEFNQEKVQERIAVQPQETEEGVKYYEGEKEYLGEVFQDGQGYFYNVETDKYEGKRVYLAPICYDEILHSPEAKTEGEIKDKAYKFCMEKEEVIQRFGSRLGDKVNELPYKSGKTYRDGKDDRDSREMPGKYLEGWEIYCKHTKKVYWVVEDYSEDFLDVKDDPYGFENFFPSTKFVISCKPDKDLFPTPGYVDLRPTLEALHCARNRVFDLVEEAIVRKALIDGSVPELEILRSREGGDRWIAVQQLQKLIEDKGGLNNLVWFFPVAEFVNAISELNQLEEKFDNDCAKWIGVPDVLQGISDPVETLGAQEIKTGAAHDRFKDIKKQIQQMAEEALQMMVDLSLEIYSPQKLWKICGMDFAEPNHQQNFSGALEFLKNDEERCIRISIESDSLSFIDENQEIQKRNLIAKTITDGLNQLSQMQDPKFMQVGLKALLYVLDGMGGSKDFESMVKSSVEELIQGLSQPQEGPPPPDYEQMKLDIAAQKNDIAAQKNSIEAQVKARELDQQDARIQLEGIKQMADQSLNEYKASTEARIQEFLAQLEAMKLQLERTYIQLDAYEKLLEERRLGQAELQDRVEALDTEPRIPQAPSLPPINITVDASKPMKRQAKVIRDPLTGAMTDLQIEEIQDLPV